ncbi:polysaccharide lyase family 8 super-sandwich domain-containing protein [Aeoliella sp.]|uniref:polysaccharide lyase family 8 super-sandwich domain-containing protein n=1 Tax=Aeoliella sp. TaxID=2795800 RepID=UPI003CCB9304
MRTRSAGQITCFLVLVIPGSVDVHAANATSDLQQHFEQVLQRHRQVLKVAPSMQADEVQRLISSLSDSGSWDDLDYDDQSHAGWIPCDHLLRARAMAQAYATESQPLAGDAELRAAINRAVEHWVTKRYKCPNWWYNRIGVPQAMRDVVVLMGDDLDEHLQPGVIEVIDQCTMGGTGANLVWTAEVTLHHGCLTNNAELTAKAAQRLANEVTLGAEAGIQRDASFFQHGPRLHSFGYGRFYTEIMLAVAWELDGTPWQFPPEKRDIFSWFLLDGQQWMSRGKHTVPSTMDRVYSRKSQLQSADFSHLLPLWNQVSGIDQQAFQTYLDRLNGSAPPLVGHRHFRVADFTVHHRPAGSFFLKTLSPRTRTTESINSENLKGKPYLHSGDMYVVRDGMEYEGLQPVLDWRRLPGITTSGNATQQHSLSIVGGLGAENSGITAMDYRRDESDGRALSCRKSWFFYNDIAICLLSGWNIAIQMEDVVTSLEQCRYRKGMACFLPAKSWEEWNTEEGEADGVVGVLHHGVGYLALGDGRLSVTASKRTGEWGSVNRRYQGEPSVAVPVLQIEMQHASNPEPCGYAVIVGATQQRLVDVAERPPWRVLRNDGLCQAVEFGEIAMATFFAPGTVVCSSSTELPSLAVDRPCIAIWTTGSLQICDPTQTGGTIHGTFNGEKFMAELPPSGTPVDME